MDVVGQACLHSYKERYRAMTVSGESHQEAVAGGLERGRPKGAGAGEEIGEGDKGGQRAEFYMYATVVAVNRFCSEDHFQLASIS